MREYEHTPQAHGVIVRECQRAVIHGESNLADVPFNVRQVIAGGAWTNYITPDGEHKKFDDFILFCQAPLPTGLATDLPTLIRFCQHDAAALDALDRVTRNPAHRPKKTGSNASSKPFQNTRQHALRHLRDKRPDLHARVLAGELSPHRAMVEAGLRRATMTVPADDAGAAVAALVRRFGNAAVQAALAAAADREVPA